ncbi:MAG: right-handed parallel beta-helix repeat-containing protein [Acidobacteria bacterium]|nr:right-handed parallel beta-helix repeat-containing protein [Acidobacteriota bacterium]
MTLETSIRRMLCIATLATCAGTLYAADGIVLIDQRIVMQGKVTPNDMPGFPVTISQPGSYRLSGNLVVPDSSTTAIQITADNVMLDLNGFSIMGPNVCTSTPTVRCTFSGGGIGVMAVSSTGPSPANVRVINGTVSGMGGHGIRMMGDGTVVEKVHAVSNGGPGIVVGEGSVIDSVAKLNGSGAAIIGSIVRGCTSSNNVFGIFVRPGGVASGNIASNNAVGGISVTNATARGNTAYNNTDYGIDGVCPGVIVENTANRNAINIRTNGACTMANNAQ